ncbi:MAG: tetratricopeptide repeat protein [Treponema sp.]|nr:tetratricopeptide repeat protein [Treponema sp.]
MPSILRKLMSFRNILRKPELEDGEIAEEKWSADFSRHSASRFEIKSEENFDVSLRKNLHDSGHSLVLSLHKTGSLTWVEAPECRYRDQHISGSLRIDARGGYSAAGILFRMVDDGTHYSFLISSKGYFRLDALRNGMPLALVGWTEIPQMPGALLSPDQSVDFSIICYGTHIVIIIRGHWAAEVNDASITEGSLGFAAVSYDAGDPAYKVILRNNDDITHTAEAFLESLTVDSHLVEVAESFEKWRDNPDIDSGARLRLAETFTAMTQYNAAMTQLRKSWEVSGRAKTQKELLLAGKISHVLGRLKEAESYISECFQANLENVHGMEAVTEMAKILYSAERHSELSDYCAEAVKIKSDDAALWTFWGHALWNLKKNKEAASAYERAFELQPQNGLLAKNAANMYDIMGRKKAALKLYLAAASAFMKSGNYNDLGLIIPIMFAIDQENYHVRSLAGKWAFAVEDWNMAEKEFEYAEKLRSSLPRRLQPPKDGAQVFLEALLFIRAGKRREALPLLREAVSLEENYALFHFRLAETLFILDNDPKNPEMLKALDSSLSLCRGAYRGADISEAETSDEKSNEESSDAPASKSEDDGLEGWVNNFAAQIALHNGNVDNAINYIQAAANILGDVPAVRINRALLLYLRGFLDKALEVLDGDNFEDHDGAMANCAGNLLVRAGRFEDADVKYRKALAIMPDHFEYLRNRASNLMELNFFVEAEDLLVRANTIKPSPDVLEMISYAAAKKGEYTRAEQACRMALGIDPHHAPSLTSLGWILLTLGKHDEIAGLLKTLDTLELSSDAQKGRDELRSKLDNLLYRVIQCDACPRSWKIEKDLPQVPALRIYAMPPDDLPAGSCADCGKTYCIGCAKEHTDTEGRFLCSCCDRSLKLVNDGLKAIIHKWAIKDGNVKDERPEQEPQTKAKRGRPRKIQPEKSPQMETPPPKVPAKRGRPRKDLS